MHHQLKVSMQIQVKDGGVLNGFCYPYARLLLNKLISIRKTGKVLDKDRPHLTSKIGRSVASCLCEQIHTNVNTTGPDDIDELIDLATEFLATFEE